MTQEENPEKIVEQLAEQAAEQIAKQITERLEKVPAMVTEGFLEYVDLANAVGEEVPEWLDDMVADLEQEAAVGLDVKQVLLRGEELLASLDKNIDRLVAILRNTMPNS